MKHPPLALLNLWGYGLFLVLSLLSLRASSNYLTYPRVALAATIVFFLSGANLTALTARLWKLTLDRAQFVMLSILASLFLVPLALLGVYAAIGQLSPVAAALTYFAMPLLSFLADSIPFVQRYLAATQLPALTMRWRPALLIHPLTLAAVLLASVHLFNVTLYPYLSTLDPYTWIIKFTTIVKTKDLHIVDDGGRTLFTILITSFYYFSGVSFFVITKYLFSLGSLLTIPAVWLIARTLRGRFYQFLILLTTIISPVIIFEFEIVRQQLLAIIYTYYALALTVEYSRTGDRRFFLIAGLFSFIGILYHPFFAMMAICWVLSAAYIYRARLWLHKLAIVLLLAATFPLLQQTQLGSVLDTMNKLSRKAVERLITGQTNWHFPAAYTNIDRNELGWPGLSGVLKYYAFYAGPVNLAILGALAALLLSHQFRDHLRRTAHAAFLWPGLLLAAYFMIAEVLPRTSRIAYLPDRVWQMIGILLTLPLLVMIWYLDRRQTSRRTVFLVGAFTVLAFGTSIGGAMYVNYLGQFTMPAYERRAAQWIKTQLPPGRIILASSSKNLIRFHSGSQWYHLTEPYFSDQPLPDVVNRIAAQVFHGDNIITTAYTVQGKLSRDTTIVNTARDEPRHPWPPPIAADEYRTVVGKPIYLYYARTHPKNLYVDRPYQASFTGERTRTVFPVLDQHPDIFRKIYQDGDQVYLWTVTLPVNQPAP